VKHIRIREELKGTKEEMVNLSHSRRTKRVIGVVALAAIAVSSTG